MFFMNLMGCIDENGQYHIVSPIDMKQLLGVMTCANQGSELQAYAQNA